MVAYLQGEDSLRWQEEEFSGYLWRDNRCGLVWTRKHQAENCASRDHQISYEDSYPQVGPPNASGQREVTYNVFVRRAVRREGSKASEDKVPANARRLPVYRPTYVCDSCEYATQSTDTVAAHSVNGHQMTVQRAS